MRATISGGVARTQPRRRPRQERSEATVEALIEATRQIVRTEGYEAATTTRIAERAGFAVASLYEYFPNKAALVAALIDRQIARLMEVASGALADVSALPLERGVPVVIGALFAATGDEALHRELVSHVHQLERLNPTVRARRQLGELLAASLATRTDVQIPNPRITARLLANAVDGALQSAVFEPGLISDPAYVDAVAQMVIRTLRG